MMLLLCALSLHCRTRTTAGSQDKFEEADLLVVRAIEIQEKALGREHPMLASSLSLRGKVLQAQVWESFPETLWHMGVSQFQVPLIWIA